MNNNALLDEILLIIRSIKDDREQLEKLHEYMLTEFYNEEEEESDPIHVPEQYQPLVKDLADSLSAGLVCFINPDTLEKIEIPKLFVDTMILEEDDEEAAEGEEDIFYQDMKRIDREWKQTITLNPPQSYESFPFMEQFVNTLPDSHLRKILAEALSGRKPFRHFNNIIHQSAEREAWFAFRQKCLENYVTEILAQRLWKNESGK